MLCTLCIWQIPTEINPACNFHWHNGCDCITLLKVYCFLKGEVGKRRERACFYFINRICKSVEILNRSLGCKLLVCKDWIGLCSRLGSAQNWCSSGTGTCCATHSSLQRPLLPGASAFRDTGSQIICKVWVDLTHLFKCKLKREDFILLSGEVSQLEGKFLL